MAGMPHYARRAGSDQARRRLPRAPEPHAVPLLRTRLGDAPPARPGHGFVMPATSAIGLAQAGQGSFPKEQPDEVITVWWQYIAIPALLAAGIYGFVVLVRHMTQQVTRETSRRAEDMYGEFGSTRKEKDRWPI
jgi:hypothetical protein